MPSILAFSSPGESPKTIHSQLSNFNISGVDPTLDLLVTEDGLVQGFNAIVNIRASSVPGQGVVNCRVLRNNAMVSSGSFAMFDGATGIIFTENLNFLAGSQIKAGELFQLEIDTVTTGTFINCDVILSITITPQGKTYIA